MKILVISTPIFRFGPLGCSGYSGLEHLAWQTARGLAKLGHSVTLVAPDDSVCPGVSILPVGPEQRVDERTAFWKYQGSLGQFDVIIDHSWAKWSYTAKMGWLEVPVLGVCHAPINTMYQTLPPIDKPCFVCISGDQASHFQALFGREARVCYNGVDLDFYKPLNVPRSDRFLFLARFSSIKGADIAIEACKEANVGLDLVGDTTITNEPEFLARIQKMADGKQIRFVGPATRGECVYWFSQAHALLHPNQRFREPFGLAPVEAMACGCPVIAWDYGAMRETVEHGKTGWLPRSLEEYITWVSSFALGEKGLILWKPVDRKECRERAEHFSVEKMVCKYEELCVEALDGGW